MRFTIIKFDNVVGVDGVFKTIDLSNIQPPNFHALQWEGPTTGVGGEGEIEYSGKPKPLNKEITDLGEYYQYYTLWLETQQPPPPNPWPSLQQN
jgi:hypothetical protein